MSLKAWRLLALLALAACVSLTAAVVWVGLAYGSNLRKITEGAQVCLAGSRAYDSVAAAQMIGRLDLVSFLLTIGGLMLAVFALMGFWMIRREALDKAGRVAREEARRVAQQYAAADSSLDENTRRTYIRRASRASVDESKRASVKSQTRQSPSFDPASVSLTGAVKERSDDDDERAGSDGGDPATPSRRSPRANGPSRKRPGA